MNDRAFIYGKGWYEEERDDFSAFRWMSESAELAIPAGEAARFRYLTLPVFSEFRNFSQVLTVRRDGRVLAEIPLLDHWNYYGIPLSPEGAGEAAVPSPEILLTLSLNKLFPFKHHPDDTRRLGVRIGPLDLHDDETIHRNLFAFRRNAELNYREMTGGRTVLESFPLNLGIDIHGKCNISPHCVYCLWDSMKVLEGDNVDIPVDAATLEGYGPFFTSARTLVNCSFGEPLLHPKLTDLLEFCSRNRKIVELATNGQAFTERTIKALVGKPIYLYISLDAASKATYAKIRNDRWDEIIPGLKRLGEERRKAGNLPRVFMVFIPMRVNRDDLEEYFKLCLIVGADALVLRPMLFLTEPDIIEERGGHRFEYAKEMLNRREVEEVIRKAGECSRKYGVPLASQFDFGLMKDPVVRPEGEAS
jgi:MoaA/NifB/PqqE/SkfB family radical SAM enzyme